ncbi:uncharacterized protein LOC123554110 [Mercenaria mercenaria]|uniref:uncharacterized protein LOC123554110 n=1 Tax=Mercenaria mercenaria TaxID=6596 RepID=UPI00234F4E85|nr:uncharacterized protein LOC123554110 [Mercenaria mercenaria]XP_053373638.1 uncharacterized protein LOC123554110 [Mercenaria mercenaria]
MSNPNKIKSKPYRNWVRGTLGLFYLQEGLCPFTDRVVKAEHARIVQNLTPCTNCVIEDILPAHASGNFCIQKNKARCNCRKRTNRNCPTCSKIYDQIVQQHRFKEPHWVTDCSTWYSDHWQFAKCFLTTSTKGSNNNAAETDASGLLSIIINGEFFQSELQCIIDPQNDIFSQVRNMRNEFFHNSTLDLKDHEVTRYLQSMIAVLEDKKTLSSDLAAQAAVKKLKEILNDELVITTTEEAKAIQTALDAIRVAEEQAEESIRKQEEESRISLQQQTLESTTEINAAKEGALEQMASTVSRDFKQSYEPEMKKVKLRVEDHESRLRAVEAGPENLQRKKLELEQLKFAEVKHQTRIEYLKQRQGLQKHLMDEYQQHYVKTWISPLMTQQNDVNISDVYVSPRMVIEEIEDRNVGNLTEAGIDRGTKNKHIERYRDLFYTDDKNNRKIFIVGDVGTGKSSFCKMMLQNWCRSIAKRGNTSKSDVMDNGGVMQVEEYNTCDMNQFDFLFYIPLREMQEDFYDTVDMIKARWNEYRTLVDDIFTDESDRILILLDGLDEWTPPRSNRQSLHGIPTSRFARDSTILTTSRPSSRGILNLKSSEYNLKVTLLGLKESSVKRMIKNFMKLLNKTSAVATFYETLSNLPFRYIHNAPMLLQQIIWLYCSNYEIGKSRTSVYLHIVNAVLGWERERHEDNPKLQSDNFGKLPLPKSFDDFARLQDNRELLLLIGKIAYHTYIQKAESVSSLVFGRNKLKQLGVSADEISAILRTGILTEVNCSDPTFEKSQLSFTHTSNVEFFATLFTCCCYLSEISVAHSSVTPLTILEGIIAVTPKTSIAEILRLENVLIMMCGLVPGLTEHVCECIYKLTPSGENMDKKNFLHVVKQIQGLAFACLSEHNSVDQETIVKFKLRHFDMCSDIDEIWLKMCFSCLETASIETCSVRYLKLLHEQSSLLSSFLSKAISLQTLKIHETECTKEECDGHIIDLTNQRNLQRIELWNTEMSVSGINLSSLQSCEMFECVLSHEQFSLLSSCLSHAVSLRTLDIAFIDCNIEECEGHAIDLKNHRELEKLALPHSKILVSDINHSCLQVCEISDCKLSHEKSSLLSSCLSKAVSLQTLEIGFIECTKDDCEGHIIDLTNLQELQKLMLLDIKIYVLSINPTMLKSCIICHASYNVSHEHCASLCSSLTHANSLYHLRLQGIKCIENACSGHYIDLTNHSRLEQLSLLDCNTIFITGFNSTCFKSCEIRYFNLSHEHCALLCTSLSHAESLHNLELDEIKCIEGACEGHCLDLMSHKRLWNLSISDCKTISIIGINPTRLEQCNISNCNLSYKQCASLCTSLSHAKSLYCLELKAFRSTEDTCEGHYLDLTNHKKLNHLSMSYCNTISITSINPACLRTCDISNCNLSHEQCASLCSSLSLAESLDDLKLDTIRCIEKACDGHYLDLTDNKRLKQLSVIHCNTISVTGINPTCLESCHISNCNLSHEQCASLCSSLSQAESLCDIILSEVQCIEDRCTGHDINLTNHKLLKDLSVSNCNTISITSINPACLESCDISNCNLSHEQYASLCSSLSEAKSLDDLKLDTIRCIEKACDGHYLDLTDNKRLKQLSVINCNTISDTGINPTCLESCHISNCNLSHEQCASLCSSLSQAESLCEVILSEVQCIEDRCPGHDIDLANHKQLKDISISNCNTIFINNPT